MKIDWKLLATLACSLVTVLILGAITRSNCTDCFRPHGWPFPYYREGGFGGGACFLWGGMLGDAVFVVTAAMILWACWNAALPRSIKLAESVIRRRSWGWLRVCYSLVVVLDLIGVWYRQATGQIDARLSPANGAESLGTIFGYGSLLVFAAWLAISGYRKINTPSPIAPHEPPTSSPTPP